MFYNEVYISPKHVPDDFIRLNLQLSSTEDIWSLAIDIFKDRIHGRFINAIDILVNETRHFPNRNIDFSFSSMALMCLLIETLHQFYNGIDETPYNAHQSVFIIFLTRSEFFRDSFDERLAERFYKDIRNGIIH